MLAQGRILVTYSKNSNDTKTLLKQSFFAKESENINQRI